MFYEQAQKKTKVIANNSGVFSAVGSAPYSVEIFRGRATRETRYLLPHEIFKRARENEVSIAPWDIQGRQRNKVSISQCDIPGNSYQGNEISIVL